MDLHKHDRKALENFSGRFLHYTRSSGTSLIKFHPVEDFPAKGVREKYLFGYADREQMLEDITGMHDSIMRAHTPSKIIYYDGVRFHTITPEKAKELLNSYILETKEQFKKDLTCA